MKPADIPLDFDALLAHQDWLRALVRTLVRDADQADDVVQETWLAAITRPPSGSVRGFLRSVARNVALRRRLRDDARERRERGAARPEAGPSTAELVEREALRSALVREVIALTEPYRTAVVLRYFDNLKPPAMARRLGISAEAVRRRLRTAEDYLRKRLRARYGERWSTVILPLFGSGTVGLAASGSAVATVAKVVVVAAVAGTAYLLWDWGSREAAGLEPERAIVVAAEKAVPTPPPGDVTRPAASDNPAPAPVSPADRPVAPGLPLLLHGSVVTPGGVPIPGARVRVYASMDQVHAEVDCAADGSYAVRARPLRRNYFMVEASAPGCGVESDRIPVGSCRHFALGPAGRLEGRVVFPDGRPAGAGIPVVAGSCVRVDARSRRTVTDSDGAFLLTALRHGPYRVSAGTDAGEVKRESRTNVRVAAGRTARVNLVVARPELITVTGRAIVRGDGRPLAGVPVTYRSPLAEIRTETDADGRFRLEGVSAEGSAHAPGHPVVGGQGFSRLEVRPEETADGRHIRLVYAIGTRVSGVIRDTRGRPVVGARYSSGNISFSGPRRVTDEAGRFELVGSSGRHPLLLHITIPWQHTYHYREVVQLPQGGVKDDLEVRLPAAGAVAGSVRMADGRPAAGAAVWAVRLSGHGPSEVRTVTDDSGRYRIENLPPARYRLEARVSGYPRFALEAEMVVDARRTIEGPDLVLPNGRDLAGQVLDQAGKPVVGMQVNVSRLPEQNERHGEFVASACSDLEGRFRVHGLRAGEYSATPRSLWLRRGPAVRASAGDEDVVVRTVPPARFTGRVTLADGGRPVARFRVNRVRRTGVGQLQPTTTLVVDADGRFDLSLPPDGDYAVDVEARVGDVVHRGQTDVSIRDHRAPPPLVIRLQRALALTGFVRAPDGSPVAGAAVELRRPGGSRLAPAFETTSARDGRFAIAAVPPGDYVMDCRHPDRVVSRRAIQLAPGGYPVQEFTLSDTGGSVRVEVVDGEGRPVAAARVLLLDPDGELLAPHRSLYEHAFFRARRRDPSLTYGAWHRAVNYTGAGGTLLRRFLPDGSFSVRVEAKGFRAATTPVVVRTNTVQTLRIVLSR